MSPSPRLTDEEKQNGKRAVLIPSEEIRAQMQPVSYGSFVGLVKKSIPHAPQPQTKEK
jgi:hypothetical protein